MDYQYGVVDDSIYFQPAYYEVEPDGSVDLMKGSGVEKRIMRYDIANDTIETVFEYERPKNHEWYTGEIYSKYHWQGIWYDNRNIIVCNPWTSFVYTSIDDIAPQSIIFEARKGFYDGAGYIPSTDGDLYFWYYRASEKDNTGEGFYGDTEYFMVKQGSSELIKLKMFECYWPLFFFGGYLYYQNEDDELAREKMHD